jgi:hypothetical protein
VLPGSARDHCDVARHRLASGQVLVNPEVSAYLDFPLDRFPGAPAIVFSDSSLVGVHRTRSPWPSRRGRLSTRYGQFVERARHHVYSSATLPSQERMPVQRGI